MHLHFCCLTHLDSEQDEINCCVTIAVVVDCVSVRNDVFWSFLFIGLSALSWL